MPTAIQQTVWPATDHGHQPGKPYYTSLSVHFISISINLGHWCSVLSCDCVVHEIRLAATTKPRPFLPPLLSAEHILFSYFLQTLISNKILVGEPEPPVFFGWTLEAVPKYCTEPSEQENLWNILSPESKVSFLLFFPIENEKIINLT